MNATPAAHARAIYDARRTGVAFEPGHLIMTGALHAAVPMSSGDVFRADFVRLAPVTVRVG